MNMALVSRWSAVLGMVTVWLAGAGAGVGAGVAGPEPPVVDLKQLTPTIYMARTNTPIGNPTSVISVGPDGVFLVDANLAVASDSLLAAVRRVGGGVPRLIATTHYHGDHTEGLEHFVPPAIAVAPARQRARLASDSVFLGERPLHPASLPAITFTDSLRIYFNGDTIDIFTPAVFGGHTDGDAIVHFRTSRILCVGDYLFLDKYPLIDFQAGGDLEGYLTVIETLFRACPKNTTVIPGHGTFSPAPMEVGTTEGWNNYLQALRASIQFIRSRLDEGWTDARLIEAGLPAEFAGLGAKPRYVSEAGWIRTVFEYYRSRRHSPKP
jgi:glyoxylase-like metal-dependent hydrolase (beta-lactamase superfamily II)